MNQDRVISVESILAGDRTSLAKAITLAESSLPDDMLRTKRLISDLSGNTGNSIRLAITGPPGVGKSTFIEAFGNLLITKGFKVAVLSIDPTSNQTHGSILGDKTRMMDLAKSKFAFVRPSPSAGIMGGVSPGTRESILLCEAAGYHFVIVETVGVGQSEVSVREMVDCFLLLLIPGAGDELQGLKKGIMEMADIIIINKNDGENKSNVLKAKSELINALRLIDLNLGSVPELMTCSALEKTGFEEIQSAIQQFINHSHVTGSFFVRRREQEVRWLEELLQRYFYLLLKRDGSIHEKKLLAERDIRSGNKNAFQAYDFILSGL